MQLDDALGGQPSPLMEVVDVLGDDAVEPPELPELGHGEMAGIGLGPAQDGIDHAAELPVATTAFLGAHEILERELRGIEAVPDPPGTPEVRNA